MADRPWDEKTLEERYDHAPGQFGAVCDAYEVPGETELSMVVRRVCRVKAVWPPLIHTQNRHNWAIFARRLVWRAAYELTDLSVVNIAEMFGGYSPGYVRGWATSWRLFEADDPEWWRFWGPANADLIGVPLDEAGA